MRLSSSNEMLGGHEMLMSATLTLNSSQPALDTGKESPMCHRPPAPAADTSAKIASGISDKPDLYGNALDDGDTSLR
jgi:hypothetical protein